MGAAERCKCGDARLHARSVESAVFQCLVNAGEDPGREDFWRRKADLLESKFTTDHGRHYSYLTEAADGGR